MLTAHLETGELPDLDELQVRFQPRLAAPPTIEVLLPAIASYDALIASASPS